MPNPITEVASTWAYFTPSTSKGMFVCYNKEVCPNCGATIYNDAASSPNLSLQGVDTKSAFLAAGMIFEKEFPPNLQVDFHDSDGGDEEWGCELCM